MELPSQRRYDLDWLRLITILILFLFHVARFFTPDWWVVKNNETTNSLHYPMLVMQFWRMPLLLFISGAGTYMAMNKRTIGGYIGERIKRLFVPLVFGILVITPPQAYYSQIDKYTSFWEFYKTIFNFVFFPEGTFGWHHLWFLAYLLIFSIFATPFLLFIKSSKYKIFKSKLEKVLAHRLRIVLVPIVLLLVAQLILRPYFPINTFRLLDDWALFTVYFFFFLFGLFFYSSEAIWTSIGKNRRFLLYSNLFVLFLYGVYRYARKTYIFSWDDFADNIHFEVLPVFLSWLGVLTVIGYGQHYLNKRSHFLPKINEGVYPFYILHQTLIVIIGYYIASFSWSIPVKYLSITLLTLLSFGAIYFIIISPLNIMRFLFGMKSKTNEKLYEAKEPVAVSNI